ncbi:phage portal protein [Endozoicomonas gorgoniicola]|uniref:Phage portal protein n=1 Tax=Endozoicomonas gorgoniicola TaxID=1234144 RepID=A0ABT3MV88_9GAMM|nr:phage portal protein [Endozoicomonas gorgoniicola]MCW7553301.1 phage portal protein [Endozoicomonas gorgoniicola]
MKLIRQLKRLLPFKNAAYTAAGNGRRAKNWYAPNLSPNDTLKADLGKLQARSRAAIRNDPWAASGITKLVSNVIGKGITPKSLIENDRLRIQVQDLFVEWSAESDADGLLSFTGQQSLITRSMFEAGECFVRLRPRRLEDGLSVPLQLQVLESEFVPIHYNQTLPCGNVIKGGIEFNRLGQRVAYWMHREHPAEFSFDSSKLARIPADDVLHVFEALRPG